MRRREFIGLLGGAATWPLAARAQQPAMPVVGFLSGRSLASDAHLVAAFRQALNDSGFVEGQNVAIDFRWAGGLLDGLPTLAADLVQRNRRHFCGCRRCACGRLPWSFLQMLLPDPRKK
jgi:putative tryptophan/tyrosine transport system substrate-binding protein